MYYKIIITLLIAVALSGCVSNSEKMFVCADDGSKIVLRNDGTYTVVLTDVCAYSGDYNIIDESLIINYHAAGTTQSFVLTIDDGSLIDPMGYRWNSTSI